MFAYKKHLFNDFLNISSQELKAETHYLNSKHRIMLDLTQLWNLSHQSTAFKETCSLKLNSFSVFAGFHLQ